jgi:hypothetical protein
MIRWYDYTVILITADWLTGIVFAVLSGQIGDVISLPFAIILWIYYEQVLRKDIEDDERSE